MGTDIHSRFEVRTPEGWRCILNTNPTEDDIRRHQWAVEDAKEEDKGVPPMYLEYADRNYNLFVILAGVRNGYGFAGVKTGNGFESIAADRGVPDDASEEFKELNAQWGGDGHAATWVTLAEILDPTWQGKRVTLYGIVSKGEYLKWRELNAGRDPDHLIPPDSYCGGIWGSTTKVVSLQEADAHMAEGDVTLTGETAFTHVRLEWTQTYRESVRWFMEWVEGVLLPLGHPPDQVRMCMFFDN